MTGVFVGVIIVASLAFVAMVARLIHKGEAAAAQARSCNAPIISPPTTREGIAELMQRIDDRHIAWSIEQAKKMWDVEQAALRNAATEILKAYDDYRNGHDVVFAPPTGVIERLRAALEAPCN